MATCSFTDTYTAKRSDVEKLYEIINDKNRIRIKKAVDHKDMNFKELLDILVEKKEREYESNK